MVLRVWGIGIFCVWVGTQFHPVLARADAPALKMACIGADGQIKNSTSEDSCKAILPKCSELSTKNSKEARRLLSMKIMGYYKGLDLDLNQSTKENLVGAQLNIPVCSVVGHDLAGTDHELSQQMVGKKASCGKIPYMTGKSGSKRIYLEFQGEEGLAWSAWMMGAYPWGIRSASYDVFKDLKPDLSNLDALIQSVPMQSSKARMAQGLEDARKFYRELPPEAKSVCNSGQTDVVQKCLQGGFSVTDPAIRVCTLYRAQLAFGESAFSHLLVGEVMARTQKKHDDIFKSVIRNETRPLSGDQGMMNQLMHACNRRTEWWRTSVRGDGCGGSRRRKLAAVGSCLNNGKRHYTNGDWRVQEGSNSAWIFPLGKCMRNGSRTSQFNLQSGRISTNFGEVGGGISSFVTASLPATFSGGGGNGLTQHKGFAGGIEFLIRRVICGATKSRQSTPRCDISEATGIPNKPSDMSW
jgi:hypothetical protein